jgi:voltage-gated potassium channel
MPGHAFLYQRQIDLHIVVVDYRSRQFRFSLTSASYAIVRWTVCTRVAELGGSRLPKRPLVTRLHAITLGESTMPDDVRDRHPRLQLALQILILYSIVTMVFETEPVFGRYAQFFKISEMIVVMLFTLEYFACWALHKQKRKYPFRLLNVIDLLAIAPFYLQFGVDLRMLRILRFIRIFRVLKLARYSRALDTLHEAVRKSAPELVVTGCMAILIIVAFSMLLYFAEHDAQPEAYSSILTAMWSVVVTLSTVGYGDIYPITVAGRLATALLMLTGIGFIAIPTGIVSSRLTDILAERRDVARSRLIQSVRYKGDW